MKWSNGRIKNLLLLIDILFTTKGEKLVLKEHCLIDTTERLKFVTMPVPNDVVYYYLSISWKEHVCYLTWG